MFMLCMHGCCRRERRNIMCYCEITYVTSSDFFQVVPLLCAKKMFTLNTANKSVYVYLFVANWRLKMHIIVFQNNVKDNLNFTLPLLNFFSLLFSPAQKICG